MNRLKKPKYYLQSNGEFVIENYNFAKPLANFFPGIAGKYGIPMWVFFVNRAQGICSFGTNDKDHAILEFFPADKSWQMVSRRGFRTFLKIKKGDSCTIYEPFHNDFANSPFDINNKMSSSPWLLRIQEENKTLGLKIDIEYFTIPFDNYAGLARTVSIQNTGKVIKKIEILDGLPQIVPFGTANLFLKKLSRTIEAWMKVEKLRWGVPFYKLDVDPSDRPEVIHIKEGNFYLSFDHQKNKTRIIKPIVNPENIFGPNTDFSYPVNFMTTAKFNPPTQEIITSKTPCGFTYLDAALKPKETKTFYTIIGYMRSCDALNASVARITKPGYLERKKSENQSIIEELVSDVHTQSSSGKFDLYAKQSYLDNILRGGYPVIFKTSNSNSVFYLYSRKHGDLERDYNKFHIQPTYFSQGNGNYRDVNQNRRCDIWFNPEINDANIITFMNLIQADGFNPLVVKGASYKIENSASLRNALAKITSDESALRLTEYLKGKTFTPGEIILFLEESKISLNVSYDELIPLLLAYAVKNQEAEHGEGFWTDHWHYNLDLLESYSALYPDKITDLVFNKQVFTFFDNIEIIKPRQAKYIIHNNRIQQLHSVAIDAEKKEMIQKRKEGVHLARTQYGKGQIYQTTLINKLLCVFVNKMASFDASGCGIEMEANKPNWYDALNGLPAMFGSSTCETFELKRLAIFIKTALGNYKSNKINLTQEIHLFLNQIHQAVQDYLNNQNEEKNYKYWDKTYTSKEEYRAKIKLGFNGDETEITTTVLNQILDSAIQKIDSSISKAKEKNEDLYCGYFINEVKDYNKLRGDFISASSFVQKKLPLFLEGQMHALRLAKDPQEAKSIYRATRKSGLFDRKLKMYKVTAPLAKMPEEIGRCRVFTPGWLENESVWLHMEYKYLLETLKHGLCEEFYTDFKNILIPFLKPEQYGRNILENSSFLVSSAFPEKKLWGNGFVARLSGSTVEFINIWLVMNLGLTPFFLDQKNKLCLRFQPMLAGWLFDRKGKYAFNFLSDISVEYHNPNRKNTFGKNAVKPKKIIFNDLNNSPVEILSDTISSPYAEQIRSRQIKNLTIYLD